MCLSKRERSILLLAHEGWNKYRIARRLNLTPRLVSLSLKNAQEKLPKMFEDIEWANKLGINIFDLGFIEKSLEHKKRFANGQRQTIESSLRSQH